MALTKCTECGEMMSDKAENCPHCGYNSNNRSKVNNPLNNISHERNDDFHVGYFIGGLLIPILGLVLFFIKNSNEPVKAKSALIGGIIGFILMLIIQQLVLA